MIVLAELCRIASFRHTGNIVQDAANAKEDPS